MVEGLDRIRTDLGSWTGAKETTARRMKKLLKAPRPGAGHIEVRCGLQDSRPVPRHSELVDVAGDGRYTYRQQCDEFQMNPSPTDDIAARSLT